MYVHMCMPVPLVGVVERVLELGVHYFSLLLAHLHILSPAFHSCVINLINHLYLIQGHKL